MEASEAAAVLLGSAWPDVFSLVVEADVGDAAWDAHVTDGVQLGPHALLSFFLGP
jgi:hypothetical protein